MHEPISTSYAEKAAEPAAQAACVLRQRARWLPADMDTPISLFLGMAGNGDGILLESAEVDGRWGRYSVLACDMALVLTCREGRLAVDIRDDRLAPLAAHDGQPYVTGLRALMRQLRITPPEGMDVPPITRALYGWLGFGMARLFHPTLAGAMPEDEAEAALVLPGTVLLFDHLYNRLCQISLGEHREVSSGRQTAEAPLPDAGEVTASPDEAGYKAVVERIRAMLHAGEAIQVVPSVRFSTPFAGDAFTLYRRMRRYNASPYMFYMKIGDMTLFGSSPEVMVRCTRGRLQLSPIAGTRRRGRDDAEDARLAQELRDDPKERAEHVMLVDLARNDLSRNAHDVRVDFYKEVQYYSHVIHLVSRVTGRINAGSTPVKAFIDTFPAGTLSGAPKVRAMQLIAEIEPHNRAAYGGCIGFIGLNGDLNQAITIRSFISRGNVLYYQAGAGIVAKSRDERELQEVNNKLGALKKAILLAEGLNN